MKTKTIRGIKLREDPAREKCFQVVDHHSDLPVFPVRSAEAQREKLHREINNELQSLEIAAQSLLDYPEAPWELRMQLARQCWDETRHARLCMVRLIAKGGSKGEFPILNQEWGVVCMLESLSQRLAVQNRTFEAGSMDVFRKSIDSWREIGDSETAEVMETILADEIQHVRYGNEWLNRLSQEDPRIVLKVAEAMDYLKQVNRALTPQEGESGAVKHHIVTHKSARKEAGFTEREVAEVLDREET